jgi:hypothetical protein
VVFLIPINQFYWLHHPPVSLFRDQPAEKGPVARRSPGFQVSEHFAHTELVTGITSAPPTAAFFGCEINNPKNLEVSK